VNIEGFDDLDDPFYRYRMAKPISNQGNNNTITNLSAIAKDLDRPVEMIVKFLKFKFNAPVIFKNTVLVLPGKYVIGDFMVALREFIEYFVLCPTCRLPETSLIMNKNSINIYCKCCSNNSMIDINKINKHASKLYLS
jgi:translation initiation factor 5